MAEKSKFSQSLSIEQGQSLSPLQLQISKLVSLNAVELDYEIERELEENPALEEAPIDKNDEKEEEDWELGDYASEDDIPEYKLREIADRNEKNSNTIFSATSIDLLDYLDEQLDMLQISKREKEIASYIIGNISDDGYLRRSVSELSDDFLIKKYMEVSDEEIEKAIKTIQTLEPAGIAARDLRETLLLQLKRIDKRNEKIDKAILLIGSYYEEFANKSFDKLKSLLDVDDEELASLYKIISHLNPKPGNSIGDRAEDKLSHYNPDFIVRADENDNLILEIVGEKELVPLRLSKEYIDIIENDKDEKLSKSEKEARNFIKYKIDQAKTFIEAMASRQNTLRSTMEAIIRRQKDFFLSGEDSDLKPMILKNIAEDTGLDISTISRVSSSKSVETDFGIFPLKHFFSESIKNADGDDISTKEIKAKLQEIIDGEDKKNPLSDMEIVELLAQNSYNISRRTVSKYRDELSIPSSRLRKEL